MPPFTIEPARTPAHLAAIAVLFREYADSLDIDLDFQAFDAELAALPGRYAPPEGELLLALDGASAPIGCVALRALDADACEMKRMYVRPAARRLGLGRALVAAVLREAEARGYAEMRLDTLASMTPALTLYRSFGFAEIAAYCYNPIPTAVYLGKQLGRG